MSEIAVDEPDATIITDFVYEENNDSVERKLWKFCNNVTVPRSEVVFMSQMILILIFLTFCIYKLSLTKLSCEETSVWFSILLRTTKSSDMNKIVDMSTRVFMAVVGPSGSGKTELTFKLLKGKTFYPRFKRAIFF